jgi:hypothetical protein
VPGLFITLPPGGRKESHMSVLSTFTPNLLALVEDYLAANWVNPLPEAFAHYERLKEQVVIAPAETVPLNLDNLDESFSTTLMQLIDDSGKKDSEIYNRAGIDRRLFSKIRCSDYTPSKRTILALAIALELTLEQTNDLLNRAGYSLSHSKKSDLIVEFFIKNRRYSIPEINQILVEYHQQPL